MNTLLEYIISTLLTVFLLLFSIYNISPIKFTKKDFIGLMLISLFSSLILSFFVSEYLITICVSIVIAIFLYFKTKNMLTIIIVGVFPTIIAIISNYIAVTLFALFNIDVHVYVKDFMNYLLLLFVTIIIAFIISRIVGYILNKKLKIIEIDIINRQVKLIGILLLVSLGIFYVNLVFGKDYYKNNTSMIIGCILQLVQFVFIIYIMFYLIKSIRTEVEMKYKEELLIQLNAYNSELETLYSTLRGFKHDYSNKLSTMIGYFEENDMEGLSNYFYDKILPDSKAITDSNFKLGALSNIKITAIKGLISSKATICENKKINFSIEIEKEITKINMDVLDLSQIIGIVLDNAIEASKECEEPYVNFAMLKKHNEINIIIINNYKNDIPPTYKLYESGFSTKGENRGLGLSNLKKTMSKYDNASVDISTQNNRFRLIIRILDINDTEESKC